MTETLKKQCGYVALIGAPNAGKSTLLNSVIGSKLAIVTPKVQTTRDVIRGVAMRGDCQMVFLDTPGIFDTDRPFEKAMVNAAWNGAREADAAILLIDSMRGIGAAEEHLLEAFAMHKIPRAIWLNKTDKTPREDMPMLAKTAQDRVPEAEIFIGSALKSHGVDHLLEWMSQQMPQGEWLFPPDQVSDLPMRFIAAEVTREKLFLRLRQELPYGLRVEPESWQERDDGSIKINQIVMVEREAHKKMVLGKQGQQLKEIGQSSRFALQKMLDCKVHLFLHVKVVPDWKSKKEYLPLI